MQIAERIEWWPRANVRPNPNNVRTHDEAQIAALAAQMRKVWTFPCLVAEDPDNPQHGMIVAGHGRYLAAEHAGYHDKVRVLVAEGWTQQQIDEYALFDNQSALLSGWDEGQLKAELERISGLYGAGALHSLGFTSDELEERLNPKPQRVGVVGSLAEKFGVPPFNTLNARDGTWQARKRGWLALGIRSEIGRGDLVEGKASHPASPGGGGRLYAGRTADGKHAAATKYAKPQRRKPKA